MGYIPVITAAAGLLVGFLSGLLFGDVDLGDGGDVVVAAGCGVKQPRRGGSGGAVVVGLSWWWSGCRGQVVGGGFGDGGSGAGFVDEGFVVRACGDEGGEGEVVDASWFPACA